MTRVLVSLTAALLFVAVYTVTHRTAAGVVGPSPAVRVAVVVSTPYASEPRTRLLSRHGTRPHTPRCTAANWRHRLKPAEEWIDAHESGLNPAAVEPTTHARGLGQLLPSTYAALGLTYSPDPCQQIRAQRLYLARHYGGSWAAALTHKRRFGWW